MRRLRYSINVTLDGCGDHRLLSPGPDVHAHAAAGIDAVDGIILGRVTYLLMENGWRAPLDVPLPDAATVSFHAAIGATTKHLVSSTLRADGWNTEQVRGDVCDAVRRLKEQPGGPLAVGGIRLPTTLAAAGLIDEYEFVVHPVVAAQGPRILEGLPAALNLTVVDRIELNDGVVAVRHEPLRS